MGRHPQQHGVADDLLGLPARIDVVAEVGDASWGEQLTAGGEDLVLHLARDPAVDAVTQDVVEGTEPGQVHPSDVPVDEFDIGEPQPSDPLPPLVHLDPGQVDADDVRLGVRRRERNQVARRRTTDLEDAGVRQLRGVETEQPRDGGQMPWCGTRMGVGLVGGVVVVGPQALDGSGISHGPDRRFR